MHYLIKTLINLFDEVLFILMKIVNHFFLMTIVSNFDEEINLIDKISLHLVHRKKLSVIIFN